MWRRLWATLRVIVFLLGLVGLVTLPEDAQKWAKLMGPLADYITLDRAEFVLYAAVIVFGLWILLPPATLFLREVRRFFKQHDQRRFDTKTPEGTVPNKSETPFVPKETRLTLLFHGNNRTPTAIKVENIFRWYALQSVAHSAKDGKITGRAWTIFILFDIPVNPKGLSISSSIHNLPLHEVKDFGPRHAIIFFSADLPAGTLEFEVEK